MNYLYNSFNNLKYIKNEALKSEIQMTQLSHDNSFNFHEIIEQILTKNESVISNFIHLLNSSELIQQFGSFTVNNTGSAINTGKISIQPEVVLSEEEWKKIVKNCLMEENTGQTRNEQQNNFFTSILNKLNELVTESKQKERSIDDLVALLGPLLAVTPNVIENQKNVSGNQDINHEFDCHLYQGPKTPPSPKSKKKNVKVHSVSPQELSDLKNCKVSEDSKPDDNRSDTCFDSKRTASSHTLDIHKSSMYSNQHSSTSTLKKFYAPHTILTKRAYPEHLSDISPDSNMHYSPCNLEPKADQLHRNMYQYDEQQYSGVYNCKLKPSFERFTQPPCTHSSKTHECISSTEKLARSSKYCKKLSREIDNQLLTGSEKECICSSKKRICPSTYKQYNKGDDTQSSNSCDELTIKRRPNQHPLKSKIFDKCTSEQHSHDRLNSNETDYRYRYVFPKQLHPVSRTEEVSQRHRNVSRYSFVKEEKCRYLSQKKPFRAHDRHNMVGKHELKLGFRSSFNHTTLGSYYPVKKAYFGTSQTVSSPSSCGLVMTGTSYHYKSHNEVSDKPYKRGLAHHKQGRQTVYKGPPSPHTVARSYFTSLIKDSPLSPPKVAYRINHPCKRYLNSNYSDSCETLNHHNNADNRRANCLKPASFKEVFNESRNSSLSSASSISASGEEKIGMKARLHSVISGMPDGSETVQAIDSSSNGRNYKGVHSSTLFKTISSSKSSYQSSKQSNWPATKDVGKYSSSKINRYIELPSASTSCASTAVKLADQDNISKSCNGDLVKECYIPKPKERSQTARSRSTSSSRSQTSTITSDKSRSASYTSSGSSSISNSVSSVSRHSTSTLSSYETHSLKDEDSSDYRDSQKSHCLISTGSKSHQFLTSKSLNKDEDKQDDCVIHVLSNTSVQDFPSESKRSNIKSASIVQRCESKDGKIKLQSFSNCRISCQCCGEGETNSTGSDNLKISGIILKEKGVDVKQSGLTSNGEKYIYDNDKSSYRKELVCDNSSFVSEFKNSPKKYEIKPDGIDSYELKQEESNMKKLKKYSNSIMHFAWNERKTKKCKDTNKIRSVVVINNDIRKRMNVDLNCKLGRNTDQNYNETEIEIGDGNNTTKTVVTLPDDEVRRRLAYEESDYTDNDMKEDSDDDNVENVSKGEEDKNVEELAVEEAERQDDAEEEGEVVSDGTSEIGEDEKGRCTKSSCGYSRLHSIHRLNSHICPTEAHDLSGKPRMKTDRYDARIISSDGKLKNGINLSIKHHYYKKDDRRERIGARNYTNYPKYYSSCLKPPHLIHRNRIYHRLKLHGHSSRSHHHHPGRFFSSSLRKQIFFKRLHSSRYKPEERQDTLIKSDKISAEKHFKYIPSELKYKKEDRNKFSECERTTRFKSDKHSSSKSGNLTNLTSPTSTSMKYSAMTSSAHHDSSHRHYLKHSFHKTKNDDFDHENHKILSGQSKNTRYKTVSS